MLYTEHGAGWSNCQNILTSVPASPVPNLLHTNQIPSPTDAHLIKDALSQLHPSLLQIDRDIDRIRSVLDRLLQDRQELYESFCNHKTLLSSIRQFPHELLSNIFMLSIPNLKSSNPQALKKAVMLPGQVCKHWRNVALSTPRLWSQITIDLRKQRLEEETAFAERWLARSGGCPLSISLSQYMTFDMPIPISTFDLIVAQSHRWEHLDLIISHALLDIIRSTRPQLSRLQTLSIQSKTAGEEILDVFETAPQLRSLTIGHNISPSRLRVPWSQLTYCDIHPFQLSIEECLEVLQHSPNLIECHFYLFRPGLHRSGPVIQHERLRVLSLRACTGLGPFLNNLTLPALQTFSFFGSQCQFPWAQPQFLSFLFRSACTLRRLYLDFLFVQLIDEDLIHILQLVPSVTELELRRECARRTLTTTVLVRLTAAPQDQCLLPNLTAFALDVYPELDGRAFANMIESRRRLDTDMSPNASLLETVSLTDCSPKWLDPVTISRLKSCRDRGLDIYWSLREGLKQVRFPLERPYTSSA